MENLLLTLLIILFLGLLLIAIPYNALTIIIRWKLLERMNKPGWVAFIPCGWNYVAYQKCWEQHFFWYFIICNVVIDASKKVFELLTDLLPDNSISFTLFFIYPGASTIIAVIWILATIFYTVYNVRLGIRIARSFGYPPGYGCGIAFLPLFFLGNLVLKNAQYIGNPSEEPFPPIADIPIQ